MARMMRSFILTVTICLASLSMAPALRTVVRSSFWTKDNSVALAREAEFKGRPTEEAKHAISSLAEGKSMLDKGLQNLQKLSDMHAVQEKPSSPADALNAMTKPHHGHGKKNQSHHGHANDHRGVKRGKHQGQGTMESSNDPDNHHLANDVPAEAGNRAAPAPPAPPVNQGPDNNPLNDIKPVFDPQVAADLDGLLHAQEDEGVREAEREAVIGALEPAMQIRPQTVIPHEPVAADTEGSSAAAPQLHRQSLAKVSATKVP